LLVAALLACPLSAEQGQLDGSKSLFTVLAAINAAGYDAQIDSPASHPLRKAIRDEIKRRNPPVLADIRDFVRQHRQENDTWELRLYISYALLADGPPKFNWKIKEYQLPPDVAALKDLAPLLEKFYTQAGIEELWQRSQPAFEEFIAKYHPAATRAITEVSAYLRAPLGGGYMGRTFQIVLDLLGAPNQIHPRTFLDDYYLVVTHSAEPQFNDIRQHYMRYLLDPLVTKYAEKVDAKKAVGDYALGAPYLPEHYKQDFLLLFTQCLIRAVEARLAPASKRQAMVDQAMGEGFTLTAYFAERLPIYEKQEQAMRLYFPELVSPLDFAKEERRMAKFEFSNVRVERKAKPIAAPPPPELSPVEKALEEAEDLYAKRDLDKARETFAGVLDRTAQNPLQAKAYYGLARIAALKRDPETAVKLFEKSLELGPPAQEKAWVLVYLGRLSMAMEQWPEAAQRFQAALGVEGGSAMARDAAGKGLLEAKEKQK